MEFIAAIILTFVVSGVLTAFLLPKIVSIAVKKDLYDLPDERHIHVGKVPRLGGLAFLPAMIFAVFLVFSLKSPFSFNADDKEFFLPMRQLLIAGLGSVVMYIVGVADDIAGVRYRHKFAAQAIAAGLMCLSGVWIDSFHGFLGIYQIPMWLGMPFTMLIVVLVINSINLIDGIDGLASGLCIIGISAFAFLFICNGYYRFTMVAVAALGCLVPFYGYNVFGTPEKRNKIFLGDTGSLFMGYLLSFFAIKTTTIEPLAVEMNQAYYLVYAYSILLLPVLDVLRVFYNRIRRRRNPFLPDKTHIHHKFLALGLSMRQARWLIFAISAMFFAVNMTLCVMGFSINWIILIDVVLWCAYHMILTRLIMRRYSRPDAVIINTDLINW